MVPGTTPQDPWLEAFTTLGALAMCIQRVHLGVLVAAVALRPPALLVNAVTTLDLLSRGRAGFGIGAGRLEAEVDAFGLRFPPTGEGFDWLDDTLTLAPHGVSRATTLGRSPDRQPTDTNSR